MKKILYSLFAAMTMLTSCSNLSDEERFVPVDFSSLPVNRNVLIEDFTGQRCSNCPAAAQEIEHIKQLFGEEHIISVAIHGGPLAVSSTAKVVGLRNELANEYYNTAGVEANPTAHIGKTGNLLTDTKQWLSAVAQQIIALPSLELSLSAQLTDNNSSISINVTADHVAHDMSGQLQLWVLEDSIKATQQVLQPDGSVLADKEYVHNHVLRAAVNGTWGEEFTASEGEEKNFTYTMSVDEAWKAENLSIVAFVYDNEGVQQVVKATPTPPLPHNAGEGEK